MDNLYRPTFCFIGQPLVDVGLAALTALAKRDAPEQLTTADLEAVSARLADWYTQPGSVRSFAKGTVFHNAGYGMTNPRLQARHIARTLLAWRIPGMLAEPCAFCGSPAAFRASRQDIPLLNGEALYNFGGRGRSGVPVCGACSLAIQALPFGCVRVGGRLIACHSDDPALLLALARTAVQRAERSLTLDGTLPVFAYERTRFVELWIDWLALVERRAVRAGSSENHTLTGYLFSNAGASASIRIYTLDSNVIGFVESAMHAADGGLTDAWNRAVGRAWGPGKNKAVTDFGHRPNRLYEDLLSLPDGAAAFLRRHLLTATSHHWGLTALFLRKVMGMEPTRIALLKTLGGRFAAYTQTRRRFFYPFARTSEYPKWRRHILNAADDYRRQTGTSLITFDEFVEAFTAPPGEINDWRLARDLIVLAMLDAGTTPDSAIFDDVEADDTTDTRDSESLEAIESMEAIELS